MYTIENRSANPRVFIDQMGRAVTVGVKRSLDVDLDKSTANFLQAQMDAEEEAGNDPLISISGSAEKAPSERTKLTIAASASEQHLEDEGDAIDEEEAPARRRSAKSKGRKKAKAKRGSGRKKSAAADAESSGSGAAGE